MTKSSGATRDNHRHQQKQQQLHSQEKMSNDDETAINKNQTSILKLSHRYVLCIFNNITSDKDTEKCHHTHWNHTLYLSVPISRVSPSTANHCTEVWPGVLFAFALRPYHYHFSAQIFHSIVKMRNDMNAFHKWAPSIMGICLDFK